MDKTMQHFNQYQQDSSFDWQGLRSNRFPKSRLMLPHPDLIHSGLDFKDCTVATGRHHFHGQPATKQYSFRPRLRQFSDLQHWHPRPSNKRVQHMEFSQKLPRCQRTHYQEPVYIHNDRPAGIRTFYNYNERRQYSLEDRMQRKVRIDQQSSRLGQSTDRGSANRTQRKGLQSQIF